MTREEGHGPADADGIRPQRLSHIRRLHRRLNRRDVLPPISADETSAPRRHAAEPGTQDDPGKNQRPVLSSGSVDAGLTGSPGQLERLSPDALNALVVAREQAIILRHRAVGTEHLLLALSLDSGSGAFQVMQRMGANPDAVRADISRFLVPGTGPASDLTSFTPRARLAIELAHRASARIGVPLTATEHLLIGLASENEGIAAKALNKFGVIARTAENQVTADLDEKTPRQP